MEGDKGTGAIINGDGPYEILYADPDWATEMPGELPAGLTAENCLLFLWTDGDRLEMAVGTGKRWGFRWATTAFVWNEAAPARGDYVITECEMCLVFKRGKIPGNRGIRNARQLVASPDKHEARRRIELMFPSARKAEMFAPVPAPGWSGVAGLT